MVLLQGIACTQFNIDIFSFVFVLPVRVEPEADVLHAVLPLLLQKHQPFVLLSPQTLQVLQVNTAHLGRLTLRIQQVTFQILQHNTNRE